MEDFLVKDKSNNNKVKAFKNEVKDSKDAKLSYYVVDERQGLSLVSVDLITGRSHQIRECSFRLGRPFIWRFKIWLF